MKDQKQKEGFAAYPELNQLSKRAFDPVCVSVQAAIMGNDYQVIREGGSGDVLFSGPSQALRALCVEKIRVKEGEGAI